MKTETLWCNVGNITFVCFKSGEFSLGKAVYFEIGFIL